MTSSQTIKSQIQRLSGLKFEPLAFPPALEKRFEIETAANRCARLWLEGLLAIFLFDLFLIADYFGTPDRFWNAVLIRVGVITPIALAINLSMLFRPNRYFRESSIAIAACLVGVSHLYLEHGRDLVTSAYAQFGIVAVILFGNTLMRLRFPYAVSTSALMVIGEIIFLKSDLYLSKQQKILGLCLTLGTVAITVIANYSFCREERLNYLLCLESNVMVGELNRSNEQLRRLAERDALTGLGNRLSFDLQIAKLWKSAQTDRCAMSIIIVDVDHFKVINDTYGHLYGDKVLKRIARLLAESLRRKEDVAARFGGEEFVVLLPETDEDQVLLVAERLRKLVEVAGLPAFDTSMLNTDQLGATVSCGVATGRPDSNDGYQVLLDAADRALYEAKQSGRNRVCSAHHLAI